MIGSLPAAYAGGQVASGSQVGLLGNRGVMDTPFNQTSYTAQTIQDQQARKLDDVFANDPSVRVTVPRLSGFDQLNIRGFSVSSDGLRAERPLRHRVGVLALVAVSASNAWKF